MRQPRIGLVLCASLVAGCGVYSGSATSDRSQEEGTSEARRHFQHIFYIMMENHGTDQIIGNTADAPFINSLACRYGVAMNYYGVTHPSLPNYLAAFSGDFQGIWDDCKAGPDVTCAPEEFVPDSGDATATLLLTPAEIASSSATAHWFSGENLVDRLEDRDLTWKGYFQSIPEVGSTVEYWPYDPVTGTPRKLYAQKHNPFEYFSDIRSSATRMQRLVPFPQLQSDLDANTVPSFVWISPDQCNDMHGVSAENADALGNPACGGTDSQVIALGDSFVASTVRSIMHSRAWRKDSAIVLAWDEDDFAGYDGCCGSPTTTGDAVLGGGRAPVLVITSKAPAHKVTFVPHNHYSMLATIEHLWGLDCLGETCKMSRSDLMTDLFMP